MKKLEDVQVSILDVIALSKKMSAGEKWQFSQQIDSIISIKKTYEDSLARTKNNQAAATLHTSIRVVCETTYESGTVLIAYQYLAKYPQAQKMLYHYLTGKHEELEVNTEQVLSEDEKLKIFVYDKIFTLVNEKKYSGSINVLQANYGNQNWRNAFGRINVPWIKSGSKIEISIKDLYDWHPDEPRLDQCLHQSMKKAAKFGAEPFNYHGTKMTVDLKDMERFLQQKMPEKYKPEIPVIPYLP